MSELKALESDSNVMEVIISDMLQGRNVKTNQILCDGRLKASIVVDENWVIEIHDQEMVNF